MDWSQRKVTHAARKPPNITHSVWIDVNTGGGKEQCYLKRKKRRRNERKKAKETKTTQNNKREEKKERMRKFQKKIPNPNYKIPKKNPKSKIENTDYLKMIKVPRDI